jgi:hypothetical protein
LLSAYLGPQGLTRRCFLGLKSPCFRRGSFFCAALPRRQQAPAETNTSDVKRPGLSRGPRLLPDDLGDAARRALRDVNLGRAERFRARVDSSPHAEPDNSARPGTMHAGALQGSASTVLAKRGDRYFICLAGECLTARVECAKVRRRRSRLSGRTLRPGRSGSSGLAFWAGRPGRSNCSDLAFRAGRPRFAFCSVRSSFAVVTFDPCGPAGPYAPASPCGHADPGGPPGPCAPVAAGDRRHRK